MLSKLAIECIWTDEAAAAAQKQGWGIMVDCNDDGSVKYAKLASFTEGVEDWQVPGFLRQTFVQSDLSKLALFVHDAFNEPTHA